MGRPPSLGDGMGKLLFELGGALNSSKCSWYETDYVCTNGEWSVTEPVDCELHILLPGGATAPNPLLSSAQASKILEIWSYPPRLDNIHIAENITGRYRKWLSRTKNGHLPATGPPTNFLSSLAYNMDYLHLPLLYGNFTTLYSS